MQSSFMSPVVLLRPTNLDAFPSSSSNVKSSRQNSLLISQLAPNLNVLTLEPVSPSQVLLRLEHLFEDGEHEEFSQEVEVDLAEVFAPFDIHVVEEMALGGNVPIHQVDLLNPTC